MISASITKTCSIDDCDRKVCGYGWCSKHYARWVAHGDPLKVLRMRTDSPLCSIENCGLIKFGHGWCRKHYERWKRYNDPLFVKQIQGDDIARFWSKVDKTPGFGKDGDCWSWTGSVNNKGYGTLEIKYKNVFAHRYSFFLEYGHYPTPIGRHTCDRPLCVKPSHIIEGTQRQNIVDAVERGRWHQKGEDNPSAKLTEQDIRNIRHRRKQGEHLKSLCAEFQVVDSVISNIANYKSWKHID